MRIADRIVQGGVGGDDEQSFGSLCFHESGLLPTREDKMVAVSLERVQPTPERGKAEARLKN